MPQKPPGATAFRDVDIQHIRIGGVLQHPIYDEQNVLLLAEGQQVTRAFLQHLAQRSISSLRVHESDLPRVLSGSPQGTAEGVPQRDFQLTCQEANSATDQLDSLLSSPEKMELPPQGPAFAQEIAPPSKAAYDQKLRQQIIEHREQSVRDVKGVFDGLMSGQGLDLDTLSKITDDALSDLSNDFDLYAAMGINPYAGDYPVRHALHTCMIGLCIGTNLKLDRTTLKELAVGCLIHDSGMLQINHQLVNSAKSLNQVEFLEVTKHPVKVFDKVRAVERIPQRSAFIAYQMHERVNGSGYPRGRSGPQIHFLSKVAAVADVYSALVAPRQHRPAMLPYCAVEHVMAQSKQGALDPAAVRALLRSVSLYPIGSYVLLSDGRVGKTIRAHHEEFDRPVVETWEVGLFTELPQIVDLSEERELFIVQALPRLNMTAKELQALTPKSADLALLKSLDLLDLADVEQEKSFADKRRSERKSFRQPLLVYALETDGAGSDTWRNLTMQSRNISRHGVSLICQTELPLTELVIALSQNPAQPIYMKGMIRRISRLGDTLWEYGVEFQGRTSTPPVVAPTPDLCAVGR